MALSGEPLTDHNLDEVIAFFRAANPFAQHTWGWDTGRFMDWRWGSIAMRLTGVNKPWYPTVKACSLLMGGRVEQAASVAEMVLEHQPHNLEALLVLTAAQVELGLDRRARATAELIRERYPSVDIAEWLDRNPYQGKEMVDRWKEDLVSAGAIEPNRGESRA